MEQPLSPREFVKRYSLPQLVRIHNAHLHQLNTHRVTSRRPLSSSAHHHGSLESSASSATSADKKKNRKASTVGKLASKSLIKKTLLEEDATAKDVNLLDIDQPFLLYKSYTSRQVTAHTLSPDNSGDTSNYMKTGPGLLIPENYPGWFSVVTSKGQTAGYFVTMDEVTRAAVPYFLTRDDLTAFAVPQNMMTSNVNHMNYNPYYNHNHHHHNYLKPSPPIVATPSGCYDRTVIPGGTVLRFLGVYEDVSAFILGASNMFGSVKKKRTASSLRSKSIKRDAINYLNEGGQRYAKCVAFNSNFFEKSNHEDVSPGVVVFVPINVVGRFYVVSTSKQRQSSVSYNHVYSLSHLLRVIKLPATVQLVVGPKPRNYWPELASASIDDGVYLDKQKMYKSSNYFGSFSRRTKENSRNKRFHSKSLSEATFTAVLRLEDIRVREVILASTIRPSPFSNTVNMNSSFGANPASAVQRSSSSLSASIRKTFRSGTMSKLKNVMIGRDAKEEEAEDGPVLLEFDLDSNFNFIRTFNEKIGTTIKTIKSSSSAKIPELVLNRIDYCNLEANNWRRQIKIAHDIIPRLPTSSDGHADGHNGHRLDAINSNSNDSGCSSGNNSNPDDNHPPTRFLSLASSSSSAYKEANFRDANFRDAKLASRLPINLNVKQRPSIFDHPEVFNSKREVLDVKFSKRYNPRDAKKLVASNLNLASSSLRLDSHLMIKSSSDHDLKIISEHVVPSTVNKSSRLSRILTKFGWKSNRRLTDAEFEEAEDTFDEGRYDHYDDMIEDNEGPSIYPEKKMATISDDEDDEAEDGRGTADDDHVYETLMKRSDSLDARLFETANERQKMRICKSKSTIDKLNQLTSNNSSASNQRLNHYEGRQSRRRDANHEKQTRILTRKARLDAIFPDVIKRIDDYDHFSKDNDQAEDVEDATDANNTRDAQSKDTSLDFDRDMESFEDIEQIKIIPPKPIRKSIQQTRNDHNHLLLSTPPPPPPPPAPRMSLLQKSSSSVIRKSTSTFSVKDYHSNVITSNL